jgi:hypothetical protein
VRRHFLAILLVGVVVASVPFRGFARSSAQSSTQSSAQARLAAAKRVNCTFPALATTAWKDVDTLPEVKTANLTFSFDSINTDEGSARAIGPFGASDIVVRLSGTTLNFIQMFNEGPLYVTTVFTVRGRSGKQKAVHSRHEYTEVSLPGFTSRPEQYYGECEIEP